MNIGVVVLVIFLSLNELQIGGSFLENDTFSEILSTKVNVLRQMFNPEPNFFGRNIEREHYFSKYDFIIVGSGPAGCVLANRLTENLEWKVLLIEAGKVENFFTHIPILAAYLQSTDYRWGYRTEPQENACFGMENRQCSFPVGKGLGGGSILNYMIYNRGNRDDYDRWASFGNKGWSWDEVLPYFKKSEHATMKGLEDSEDHGRYGPANIENNRHRTILAEAFVEANKYLGQLEVDYNSGDQLGVSYLQAHTINGQRETSFRAFLEYILDRPNLHIMVNTRVTKVLINPETKVAYGVKYVRNKKIYSVRAKKEVILSAGAFNSPQILMLSGVGPSRELSRIGVPLIQDLPVGQYLQEHLGIMGITFIVNTTGISPNTMKSLSLEQFLQFFDGRGDNTLPGGVEALSFIKVKEGRGPEVPDVELMFVPGSLHSDGGSGIRKGMLLTDEIYDVVYKPLESMENDTFMIMPIVFHPESSGSIRLKDKNPFHWPELYPNFFELPEDVETFLEGIHFMLDLIETPAFQKYGAQLHDIPLPNCADSPFATDNYWRCVIRTLSHTLAHQIGTCKMGPETDATSVVSDELKVHGIKNLRVADIGIIPEPPSTHTHAVSMMIGEKAADMIKQQWQDEVV